MISKTAASDSANAATYYIDYRAKRSAKSLFAELAMPHYTGKAFAITREQFLAEFGGAVAEFPPLGCEHAIYYDTRTDNHIVVRAAADGTLWGAADGSFVRIR